MSCRLPALRILEVEFVFAETANRSPKSVAHLQNLTVLGEFHVFRERRARGIVRKKRRQILINETIEASSIAGSGRGIHSTS